MSKTQKGFWQLYPLLSGVFVCCFFLAVYSAVSHARKRHWLAHQQHRCISCLLAHTHHTQRKGLYSFLLLSFIFVCVCVYLFFALALCFHVFWHTCTTFFFFYLILLFLYLFFLIYFFPSEWHNYERCIAIVAAVWTYISHRRTRPNELWWENSLRAIIFVFLWFCKARSMHACTLTLTIHKHTCTRAHAPTHAHAHTHKHKHSHTTITHLCTHQFTSRTYKHNDDIAHINTMTISHI